jgi:hypothetical protein
MRPLTRRRVRLAFVVGILADVIQLPIGLATIGGGIPLEVVEGAVDVITAIVVNRLLGFHWTLLPTFALKLIPGLDAAPTWTACVAYVAFKRRNAIIPPTPSRAKLT